MREWTVMVYFAGENRLFDEMIYSLKDLKKARPDPGKVALLAQFSAKWVKRGQASGTNLATPRRFFLETDAHHPLGSVAMNYIPPGLNVRPWKSYVEELAEFIKWGIGKYRARRYMVVFAGDGGGVLSEFLPSTAKPPKSIKPRDLSRVFAIVRDTYPNLRIDVVGLDSCLMSMTEIGYGLRRYARYLVSSEGNEDDLGWPYEDVFRVLRRMPNLAPERLASHVVDAYNTYYLDYALIAGASANLSAVDLNEMANIRSAFRSFCRVAFRLLPKDTSFEHLALHQQIFVGLLVHAHWMAQTYRQDQYTDVGDFFSNLRKGTEKIIELHPNLKRQLRGVLAACTKILVALGLSGPSNNAIVNSCQVGVRYQHSTGLSVYLPWARVEESYYQDLSGYRGPRQDRPKIEEFARVTGWGEFICRYVTLSQRPRREGVQDDKISPVVVDLMRRDPPVGRGFLQPEYETAKNPPSKWDVSFCVSNPVMKK